MRHKILCLFEKIFQFARVFQEENAKKTPKFCRPYKKILKPLPQKISGYAPDQETAKPIMFWGMK